MCDVNNKFLAVVLESQGGGAFLVTPLDKVHHLLCLKSLNVCIIAEFKLILSSLREKIIDSAKINIWFIIMYIIIMYCWLAIENGKIVCVYKCT